MKKDTKKTIFDAMSFLSSLREINNKEVFERATQIKDEITDKLYCIDKELSAHFDDIAYRQMAQIKENLQIKSLCSLSKLQKSLLKWQKLEERTGMLFMLLNNKKRFNTAFVFPQHWRFIRQPWRGNSLNV